MEPAKFTIELIRMHKQGTKKRSPLTRKVRREAGQSLREGLQGRLLEEAVPWLSLTVFAAIFAVFEWLRYLLAWPPMPVIMTVMAGAVGILAYQRIRRLIAGAEALRLGLHGEQTTGQFLQDELPPLGYRVFHDILGERGNIDHVAIGPGGIFSIETKTVSKPERGNARVVFDGSRLTVNGLVPDRDPIAQTKAGAAQLFRIFFEYAGREAPIRPVVLYPGWFVEQPFRPEVWVLNEKGFVAFVRNETNKLKPDEVVVLASALERYMHNAENRSNSNLLQ